MYGTQYGPYHDSADTASPRPVATDPADKAVTLQGQVQIEETIQHLIGKAVLLHVRHIALLPVTKWWHTGCSKAQLVDRDHPHLIVW